MGAPCVPAAGRPQGRRVSSGGGDRWNAEGARLRPRTRRRDARGGCDTHKDTNQPTPQVLSPQGRDAPQAAGRAYDQSGPQPGELGSCTHTGERDAQSRGGHQAAHRHTDETHHQPHKCTCVRVREGEAAAAASNQQQQRPRSRVLRACRARQKCGAGFVPRAVLCQRDDEEREARAAQRANSIVAARPHGRVHVIHACSAVPAANFGGLQESRGLSRETCVRRAGEKPAIGSRACAAEQAEGSAALGGRLGCVADQGARPCGSFLVGRAAVKKRGRRTSGLVCSRPNGPCALRTEGRTPPAQRQGPERAPLPKAAPRLPHSSRARCPLCSTSLVSLSRPTPQAKSANSPPPSRVRFRGPSQGGSRGGRGRAARRRSLGPGTPFNILLLQWRGGQGRSGPLRLLTATRRRRRLSRQCLMPASGRPDTRHSIHTRAARRRGGGAGRPALAGPPRRRHRSPHIQVRERASRQGGKSGGERGGGKGRAVLLTSTQRLYGQGRRRRCRLSKQTPPWAHHQALGGRGHAATRPLPARRREGAPRATAAPTALLFPPRH